MRIQVNLSDEMVNKVDAYAKQMGVSRSALCTVFVGQGIMNYDNAKDILSNIGATLSENIISEKK